MALPQTHPDFWTQALQFTPTVHRSVYPSLEPSSPQLRGIAHEKTILVTGSGSGFGRAAALQWTRAGVKQIILCGRRQTLLESVAAECESINPQVEATVCAADMSRSDDVDRAMSLVQVDVVINAAGVLGPVSKIGEVEPDEWWESVTNNLKSTFLVARAFIKSLPPNSIGTFINVGTAASYFASPESSAYTVPKAAGNMLTDQLHVEYPNLRTFNIHPGIAKSPVLREGLDVYAKDDPELFGSFTIFLAGQQSDFLRGRFLAVNWDVDELVQHQTEIVEGGLLKNQLFKANIGPGGHFRD